MEFRCGVFNSTGERFISCLNGGQCQLTNQGRQICECPDGWTHDYAGFGHFDNCTLPTSFLRIFFIVYSCIAIPGVTAQCYLLWQSRHGKTKAKRRSVAIVIFWHFMCWVNVLAVYVQNGFYEAGLISLIVYSTAGYVMGAQLSITFLEPIAATSKLGRSFARIKKGIWITFLSVSATLAIVCFAGIPYCRNDDPSTFNLVMFVMVSVSVFMIALMQGLIIYSARKLMRLFEISSTFESYSSSKLAEAQARIKQQLRSIMKVSFSFSIGSCCVLCIICVWGVFGSFPYFYISWALQFLMGFSAYPLTFAMLRRLNRKDDPFMETTPQSVERRGYETIIIQNPGGRVGRWRPKLRSTNTKARLATDNTTLSKIEEENKE